MAVLTVKQEVYDDLRELMAIELKKKLQEEDFDQAIIKIVKNKYGLTFNSMLIKLIKCYKTVHNIR
jgi:hypothetical protein